MLAGSHWIHGEYLYGNWRDLFIARVSRHSLFHSPYCPRPSPTLFGCFSMFLFSSLGSRLSSAHISSLGLTTNRPEGCRSFAALGTGQIGIVSRAFSTAEWRMPYRPIRENGEPRKSRKPNVEVLKRSSPLGRH